MAGTAAGAAGTSGAGGYRGAQQKHGDDGAAAEACVAELLRSAPPLLPLTPHGLAAAARVCRAWRGALAQRSSAAADRAWEEALRERWGGDLAGTVPEAVWRTRGAARALAMTLHLAEQNEAKMWQTNAKHTGDAWWISKDFASESSETLMRPRDKAAEDWEADKPAVWPSPPRPLPRVSSLDDYSVVVVVRLMSSRPSANDGRVLLITAAPLVARAAGKASPMGHLEIGASAASVLPVAQMPDAGAPGTFEWGSWAEDGDPQSAIGTCVMASMTLVRCDGAMCFIGSAWQNSEFLLTEHTIFNPGDANGPHAYFEEGFHKGLRVASFLPTTAAMAHYYGEEEEGKFDEFLASFDLKVVAERIKPTPDDPDLSWWRYKSTEVRVI